MCLIPNCSPLAEINRTERARISPLILGSSSVATVHHSSQGQIFGAVCPPDMISLRRRTDAAPPTTRIIILRARRPCPYTDSPARGDLSQDPVGERLDRQHLMLLAPAPPNVYRLAYNLQIPDDKQVRDLLPGVVPDLLLHAVQRAVHLDPQALVGEILL